MIQDIKEIQKLFELTDKEVEVYIRMIKRVGVSCQ